MFTFFLWFSNKIQVAVCIGIPSSAEATASHQQVLNDAARAAKRRQSAVTMLLELPVRDCGWAWCSERCLELNRRCGDRTLLEIIDFCSICLCLLLGPET